MRLALEPPRHDYPRWQPTGRPSPAELVLSRHLPVITKVGRDFRPGRIESDANRLKAFGDKRCSVDEFPSICRNLSVACRCHSTPRVSAQAHVFYAANFAIRLMHRAVLPSRTSGSRRPAVIKPLTMFTERVDPIVLSRICEPRVRDSTVACIVGHDRLSAEVGCKIPGKPLGMNSQCPTVLIGLTYGRRRAVSAGL